MQGTQPGAGSDWKGETLFPLRCMLNLGFSDLILHLSPLADLLKPFPGAQEFACLLHSPAMLLLRNQANSVRSPGTSWQRRRKSLLLLAYLTVTKNASGLEAFSFHMYSKIFWKILLAQLNVTAVIITDTWFLFHARLCELVLVPTQFHSLDPCQNHLGWCYLYCFRRSN